MQSCSDGINSLNLLKFCTLVKSEGASQSCVCKCYDIGNIWSLMALWTKLSLPIC